MDLDEIHSLLTVVVPEVKPKGVSEAALAEALKRQGAEASKPIEVLPADPLDEAIFLLSRVWDLFGVMEEEVRMKPAIRKAFMKMASDIAFYLACEGDTE